MNESLEALVVRHLQRVLDRPLAAEEIGAERRLRQDLGLTSLQAVDMVMALEEDLGISIADEELARLANVGDLLRLLARQQEPGGS